MTKREELLQAGLIEEYPLVRRAHNRHRKDTVLTVEQKENLKEVYGITATAKMTEKDVLVVLRKRHKNYIFENTITNKETMPSRHRTWKELRTSWKNN